MTTLLESPAQAPSCQSSLLEKVSASRLNTFHQCRLKFYFRYVLKLVAPTTGALLVGRAVHSALKRWSKARWLGQPHDAEALKTTFLTDWILSQQDEPVVWEQDEEEKQQGKAWDLVEMYLRDTPIPASEKPEAVEVSVEADLSGLPRLVGIIDLVRPGGKIVDFKTSAATPQASQAAHRNETQLTAYGILYRETTGEEASGFELHHLIKTKQPKLVVTEVEPVTAEREQRFLRTVESYVDGVEREDYVPSPGLHCAACEFFAECTVWKGGGQ
jgi:CRISPR/Cas system-associated exonuclease Cas4 (RecB family)